MKILKVRKLLNPFERTKGLIGTQKIYPVYFETRWGLHTFGMEKPIDILILNSKNRVVKIKKNLMPSNFYFWNPKFKKIVELPVDRIDIKIGEEIKFK